jgi:hypothetical protein
MAARCTAVARAPPQTFLLAEASLHTQNIKANNKVSSPLF